MRTALLLLLVCARPDERADRLYEKTEFSKIDAPDDVSRRVMDVVLAREHWVGAYAAIEEKFGRFPGDLEVKVDFLFDGAELARATGHGSKGKISFNLKKLAEAQRRIDDYEEQRRTAESRGQRIITRIPPVKFDRIIYHELTHVLQAGYDAPLWFLEGMAQLMGDDPNSLYAYALDKKPVKDIDAPITDRIENYARGHLFWKWLESRYAMKKAVELAIYERRPWKQALEQATNNSWASIVASEREWSEKEIERYR